MTQRKMQQQIMMNSLLTPRFLRYPQLLASCFKCTLLAPLSGPFLEKVISGVRSAAAEGGGGDSVANQILQLSSYQKIWTFLESTHLAATSKNSL